jgi:hypothetical protein
MPRVAPKAGTALLIFLSGVGLTFASLGYKKPADCNEILCEAGEQTAGFPFPVVRDQAKNLGSSPTSGWYRAGAEDLTSQDIKPFSFNILFYSAIVWSLLLLRKRLRT